MVDHKALLIKYLAVVIDNESVDYIQYGCEHYVRLTKEEKEELLKLSEQARKEFNI